MTGIYGRRVLPTTIDQLAEQEPNRAWASAQLSSSLAFEDISLFTFANAINRVTYWIVQNVGPPSATGEKPVLAYIGASDLRYYVLFVAIVKAGYVPLFTSHLNSKAANTSLFNATGCKILLNGFEDLTNIAINPQDLSVFHVPNFETVWDPTPVTVFPFNKNLDDIFYDPLLILHTSGSSGMPKPVTYTHGSFATTDIRQTLPKYEGYEPEPLFRRHSGRVLLGFPPFHGAGFVTGLQDSIFFGLTIVFPPADRPLDANVVANIIENGAIGGAALLPHVLEDLARTPKALDQLRKLNYIVWVGGPISQQAGDLIAARTMLINAYASTEIGSGITLVKTDPTLWRWYFFHPGANGFDFRPVPGQANLYELFVVRDPAIVQQVFRIFPHLDEWPMKDLFIAHPTLKHHWRLEGRSDDLIVLQNGCKLNPTATEALVKQAPTVKEALMFGAQRARPGILVEPQDASGLQSGGIAAQAAFLDAVYRFVEASNQTAPDSGKIIRELVAMTKIDKPFPRAGKQTLQRREALGLYQHEIDHLYEALPGDLKKIEDFRIWQK